MKMIFGIRRYLQIKEKQIVDVSICREVSLICKESKIKIQLIKLQASSSAIERKARYTNQAASILKCHRKKNKMQSPVSKHPQVP